MSAKKSGLLRSYETDVISSAVAYALDVSKDQREDLSLRRHHRTVVKHQKVPPIDFSRLVPRLREVVKIGKEHLTHINYSSVDTVLTLLEQVHPIDVAELAEGGANVLIEPVKQVLLSPAWPQHRSASRFLAMAVSWAIELWALEEIAGIGGLISVTDGVIPSWTASTLKANGGAAALGSLLGEKILYSVSRHGRYAWSLRAGGHCRVWVSETEWVIARSVVEKTGQREPLIFDRIPLSEIVSVRKLRPRFTLAPQFTVRFADGSRARFIYVSRKTLEMLADSLVQPRNHASQDDDDTPTEPNSHG